jgi:hypothetical protein
MFLLAHGVRRSAETARRAWGNTTNRSAATESARQAIAARGRHHHAFASSSPIATTTTPMNTRYASYRKSQPTRASAT